jgi:phage replication-related protein YjqB (UPF0714/DUF867 family)
MTDRYWSMTELIRNHSEGIDYQIVERTGILPVLVVAPHGGKIEPCTTELAELTAGKDFSFYSFMGSMARGNYTILHVSSHRFDEPRLLRVLPRADRVITFHGERRSPGSSVLVGGKDSELAAAVRDGLRAAGFDARESPPGLEGEHPLNVCNRGRKRGGCQLELSRPLRSELRMTRVRGRFVESVRQAVVGVLERGHDGAVPEGSA